MAAALTKIRLPEVNFVEQGEPMIRDLIRFGTPALRSSYPLKQGGGNQPPPLGFKTMRVRPSPARCAIAQNQPALSNARLIHPIRVASTSATALSLTL
jgi:hypothetical protein